MRELPEFVLDRFQIGKSLVYDDFVLYDAFERQGGGEFFLKVYRPMNNGFEKSLAIKEFKQFQSINLRCGGSYVDLIEQGDFAGLVMVQGGLLPAHNFLSDYGIELPLFFVLARAMSEALCLVHGRGMIMGKIRPSEMLCDPLTGKVLFCSPFLRRSPLCAFDEEVLACQTSCDTEYLAPEMLQAEPLSIDFRSDLYALGACFYQMLTGRRLNPQHRDGMRTINNLYTEIAPQLQHARKDIPGPLCEMVQKLIARQPDDRYCSAHSLVLDLREYAQAFTGDVHLTKVAAPGQHRTLTHLTFAPKIYGRERELDFLKKRLNLSGENSLVVTLIHGAAGIGKTSLVRSFAREVADAQVIYCYGKFKFSRMHEPYTAILEIIDALIQEFLKRPDEEIFALRERLGESLGEALGYLCGIFPALKALFDENAAFKNIERIDDRTVFRGAMRSLLAVLANYDRMLILHFDDLQWIDASSVEILSWILTMEQTGQIHFICTYRSCEGTANEAFAKFMTAVSKLGSGVSILNMAALDRDAALHLLDDVFSARHDFSAPLLDACLQKSGGNVLYIMQYLQLLYERGVIAFSPEKNAWTHDSEAGFGLLVPDQTPELLKMRLSGFEPQVQQVLTVAAYLGGDFAWRELAAVMGLPEATLGVCLQVAKQSGLIGPHKAQRPQPEKTKTHDLRFQFLHDSIKEAALELTASSQRAQLHFKIALVLWDIYQKDLMSAIQGNLLYRIAHHFWQALDRGVQPTRDQKMIMVRVLVLAAQKARHSAAYDEARQYIKAALQLMGENSFQGNYDLALNAHNLTLETGVLCGDFDGWEEIFAKILVESKGVVDKLDAYEIKGQLYAHQGRYEAAFALTRAYLVELGVHLPEAATEKTDAAAFDACVHVLFSQPFDSEVRIMDDPEGGAALRMLAEFATVAYLSKQRIFIEWLVAALKLSERLGHGPASSFIHACMATMAIRFDKIELGMLFAKRAQHLLVHFEDLRWRGRTLEAIYTYVWHCAHHYASCLEKQAEGYRLAISTGDIAYAASGCISYSIAKFYTGSELSALRSELKAYYNWLCEFDAGEGFKTQGMVLQMISSLADENKEPWVLAGGLFDDRDAVPAFKACANTKALAVFHLFSLQLCYIFGKYDKAEHHRREGLSYKDSLMATMMLPIFNYYDALVRLAMLPQLDGEERETALSEIGENLQRLRHWSSHAPMNHQHRVLHLEAELAGVTGGADEGIMRLYEAAAQAAYENGFVNDRALIWLCSARRSLGLQHHLRGRALLRKSYYAFGEWGAVSVQRFLVESYPEDAGELVMEVQREELSMATAMVRASRELSREVKLGQVQQRLVELLLASSGATKCAILHSKDGIIYLEAIGRPGADGVSSLLHQEMRLSGEVPASLIRYVIRTGSQILYNDLTSELWDFNDSYLAQHLPKSLFCTTVKLQGRGAIVVYLEHSQSTNVFASRRLEMLKTLIAHAAIAIENAGLVETLSHERRILEKIQRIARIGSWEYDSQLQQLHWSEEVYRIFGVEPRAFGGSLKAYYRYVHPSERQKVRLAFKEAIKYQSGLNIIHKILRPDRSEGYVLVKSEKSLSDKGSGQVFFGIVYDITEQVKAENEIRRLNEQLEKRVGERTRQLQEANQDLESFSISVSHDLKAPLRALRGYASALIEDYGSKLDQNAIFYLQRMEHAAARMGSIIDDIMRISVYSRKEMNRETFDLAELAKKVIAEFALADSSAIKFSLAPSLFVRADRSLFHILLQNLLSNAIKFSKHRAQPLIQLGVRDDKEGERVYFVRDNGAGFDMAFAAKLFVIFQRLHHENEFEGTGVGLTIVNRIIKRHGGRIWAEGVLDGGATFYFTVGQES
jgi:PAS domain S-box-containing protein